MAQRFISPTLPLRPSDIEVAAERGPFAGRLGHFDAPFRVTPLPIVERMLDLAAVGPGTRLLDLGCGDGRFVIAAARRGAEAAGIDIDPERIAEAQAAARRDGLEGIARFETGDLFVADFGGADVVTLFLLSHVNRWLEGRLRGALRPGARVVSYQFPMPSWAPSVTEMHGHCAVHLWVR
jgi:2-polyprenyl-3-methyl-5-hydroxy-6-metoxy-1,4-benzoquinol methylase